MFYILEKNQYLTRVRGQSPFGASTFPLLDVEHISIITIIYLFILHILHIIINLKKVNKKKHVFFLSL